MVAEIRSSKSQRCAKVVIFWVVFLVLLEGGLRLQGVSATSAARPPNNCVSPDRELGWVNRPGSFTQQIGSRTFTITHSAIGSRITPCGSCDTTKEGITFLGDSFIHGFTLPDEQTFPYKVSARNPAQAITNFGVPGYSTVQALLLLDRLNIANQTNHLVVYGLADFHLDRNIAGYQWLRYLTSRRYVTWKDFPFAALDNNNTLEIRRLRDERLHLPFFNVLSSSYGIERTTLLLAGRLRERNAEEVTKKALQLMRDRAHAASRQFMVVLTSANDPTTLVKLVEELHVPWLDLRLQQYSPLAEYTTEDGHPNHLATERWSDAFQNYIELHRDLLAGANRLGAQ